MQVSYGESDNAIKTTAHQSSLFNIPVIHHSDDVAVSFVTIDVITRA